MYLTDAGIRLDSGGFLTHHIGWLVRGKDRSNIFQLNLRHHTSRNVTSVLETLEPVVSEIPTIVMCFHFRMISPP